VAERAVSALRQSRSLLTDPAPSQRKSARTRPDVVLPMSPSRSYLNSPSIAGSAVDAAASADDVVELSGRLDRLASRLLDSERDKESTARALEDARRELQTQAQAQTREGLRDGERGDYGFSPPRNRNTGARSSAPTASVSATHNVPDVVPPRESSRADPYASLQQDLNQSREDERSVRLLSTRYAEELESALAALEREKHANIQLRRQNDDLLSARDGTGATGVRIRELEQQLRAAESSRDDAITGLQRAESELERTQDKLASTAHRLAQREDDLKDVRERCRIAESERDALENSISDVERAAAKAVVKAEDAHNTRVKEEELRFEAERQVASLTARLGAMQRDMDAYLKAASRSDLLKVMATKGVIGTIHAPPSIEASTIREGSTTARAAAAASTTEPTGAIASVFSRLDGADQMKARATKTQRRRRAYLDASSDTSVEGYEAFREGIEEGDDESSYNEAGNAEAVIDPTLKPYVIATGLPGDRPKTLEAAAVEAVAFVLYSELNNADLSAIRKERGDRRRYSQASNGAAAPQKDLRESSVGEACVTAAMRLIRTAIKKSHGTAQTSDNTPAGVVRPVTADDIILPLR